MKKQHSKIEAAQHDSKIEAAQHDIIKQQMRPKSKMGNAK